jgi:hypothetical protein
LAGTLVILALLIALGIRWLGTIPESHRTDAPTQNESRKQFAVPLPTAAVPLRAETKLPTCLSPPLVVILAGLFLSAAVLWRLRADARRSPGLRSLRNSPGLRPGWGALLLLAVLSLLLLTLIASARFGISPSGSSGEQPKRLPAGGKGTGEGSLWSEAPELHSLHFQPSSLNR